MAEPMLKDSVPAWLGRCGDGFFLRVASGIISACVLEGLPLENSGIKGAK